MPIDKFGRSNRRKINNNTSSSLRTLGYKVTSDGQLNMENRQLKNIAEPTDSNDAVTTNTLNTGMEGLQKFIDNLMTQALHYIDSYHQKTIQTVLSKQADILTLISEQETKIRNLINTRCDAIEKEYNQLKLNLKTLDQHMQVHASTPIDPLSIKA